MIDLIDLTLHWPIRLRFNPLYWLFIEAGGGDFSSLPPSYLLFCKVWFAVSCILLSLTAGSRQNAIVVAVAAILSTITVEAEAVWSMMHCFPTALLLILLGVRLEKAAPSRGVPTLVPLVGVLLWASTAGPFAVVGCVAFLPWLSRLKPESFAVCFFSSLAASILFVAPYPLPELPDNGRLAPVSPATFWGSPILGPELRSMPLRFDAFSAAQLRARMLAETIGGAAIVLLILLSLRSGRVRSRYRLATAVFFVLLPIWMITETASGFSLTLLLTKVAFGLALAPMPHWILFGLILGSISVLSSREDSFASITSLSSGLLLSLLVPQSPSVARGELKGEPTARIFSDAVRTFFASAGAEVSAHRQLTFTSLAGAHATSNFAPELAANAVDGNHYTRWTTGTAQKGGEELEVRLLSPKECPVVRLRLDEWGGDFPRGIAIDVKTAAAPEAYRQAVSFPSWQGSLRVSDSGIFYFGSQSVVDVPLGVHEKLTALRFRQTGTDRFFYWSISEVECSSGPVISSK